MSIPVLNVLLGADGRWVADETGEVVAVASLERFEAVPAKVYFTDGSREMTLYLATRARGYVKAGDLAPMLDDDLDLDDDDDDDDE